MADFLVFWPPKTKSGLDSGASQKHWAGANLKNTQVDDTIWVVKADVNGRLALLFPLIVGWRCYHEDPHRATKDAAELIGNDDVWLSKGHVFARAGTAQNVLSVDITDCAGDLRFVSKTGKDRLHLLPNGRLDLGKRYKQQIRSIRRLTDDSVEMLRKIWREAAGVAAEAAFATGASTASAKARSQGAGFGSAASNEEVESAAMRAARAWYERRGWDVVDVSREGIGYDLRCFRRGREEHVEVKGVKGDKEDFLMWFTEKNRADADDEFVVFVVTNALSPRPKLHRYNRTEFAGKFRLKPIQFRAALREDA